MSKTRSPVVFFNPLRAHVRFSVLFLFMKVAWLIGEKECSLRRIVANISSFLPNKDATTSEKFLISWLGTKEQRQTSPVFPNCFLQRFQQIFSRSFVVGHNLKRDSRDSASNTFMVESTSSNTNCTKSQSLNQFGLSSNLPRCLPQHSVNENPKISNSSMLSRYGN